MTCIKTGAVVIFPDYGVVQAADIYLVGGAYVIRAAPERLCQANEDPELQCLRVPTHEVFSDRSSEEFWRDDIGIFVVKATNFRKLP